MLKELHQTIKYDKTLKWKGFRAPDSNQDMYITKSFQIVCFMKVQIINFSIFGLLDISPGLFTSSFIHFSGLIIAIGLYVDKSSN